MGLRETAYTDMISITTDLGGFGWPVVVVDPDGNTCPGYSVGFSNDIAQMIDPDTGQAVSGRSASVALAIPVGGVLPVGIADTGCRPWTVRFNDIWGTSHKFKVAQSMPDRTIGLVVLTLEAYRD